MTREQHQHSANGGKLDRSQLRVIETEQRPFIRYGIPALQAELQQGKPLRQLPLADSLPGGGESEPVDIYGLNLTYAEQRALNAVMWLLHKTGYSGHAANARADRARLEQDYGYRGPLPVLLLDGWGPYLEAYGVGKGSSGRFHSNQRSEAEEALFALAEPRQIWLQWRLNDRFYALEGPEMLVKPQRLYSGMTEEQATAQRETGRGATMTGLRIDIGPLIMVGLERGSELFALLPADLFDQINSLFNKARISNAVPLFIKYVLTWDLPEFRTKQSTLAHKLYLDYYLEQRKPAKLRARLEECFHAALKLGFLLEQPTAEIPALGDPRDPVYRFRPNPEMCSRLRADLRRQEAAA